MATTTNYAWETPDDTDLVKDGAAAIRTLGSSIDTTTKALNPSTTLGDIEYRSSTANTNSRLGIGSSGQVLTVSAGVPAWATPAAGSLTLITAQSFTTSSAVNVNNCFSATYQNYLVQIVISTTSTSSDAQIRLRASGTDATTDYRWAALFNHSAGPTASGAANNGTTGWNDYLLGYDSSGNVTMNSTFFRPFASTPTTMVSQTVSYPLNAYAYNYARSGVHTPSNSYDGFSIIPASGTITGNLRVYGLANA